MSEEQKLKYGRRDPFSGARWVHVTREMAHAHPKGQLNWALVGVACLLFFVAGQRLWMASQQLGPVWGLLMSVIPLFCAVLVLMRAPIARTLLIILGGMTIYSTVRAGIGGGFPALVELLVILGITIWMWEGERPNLAYGYRYRSYKDDDEVRTQSGDQSEGDGS
ncbi:MAG: hypothetical protein CSA70_01750 [Rhodobacterales bacterium]|nr:MAG: hypothetical protein CSA70_01750 [Rhodobacterales bacterium]